MVAVGLCGPLVVCEGRRFKPSLATIQGHLTAAFHFELMSLIRSQLGRWPYYSELLGSLPDTNSDKYLAMSLNWNTAGARLDVDFNGWETWTQTPRRRDRTSADPIVIT